MLLLVALACVTTESWSEEFARAVCQYKVQCEGVGDVDGCVSHWDDEACDSGTEELRQACLDDIEQSTGACDFEYYSDAGEPCDWVWEACWGE